jgi:hypothetical protein
VELLHDFARIEFLRTAAIRQGFEPDNREIDLHTNVPLSLEITLAVATQRDAVTVSASDLNQLVDPTLTGTRTAVSLTIIEHMPAATGSRGLESGSSAFPGSHRTPTVRSIHAAHTIR